MISGIMGADLILRLSGNGETAPGPSGHEPLVRVRTTILAAEQEHQGRLGELRLWPTDTDLAVHELASVVKLRPVKPQCRMNSAGIG
jgi:hypothetical protein